MAEKAAAEAEAATAEAKLKAEKAQADATRAKIEREAAEVAKVEADKVAMEEAKSNAQEEARVKAEREFREETERKDQRTKDAAYREAAEKANADLAREFKERMQKVRTLKKAKEAKVVEAQAAKARKRLGGPLANQMCKSVNDQRNLDAWCESNCKVGFCPPDKCACTTPAEGQQEEAAANTADDPDADDAAIAQAIAAADEAAAAADAAEAKASQAENALLPMDVPLPAGVTSPNLPAVKQTAEVMQPSPSPAASQHQGVDASLTDEALFDLVKGLKTSPNLDALSDDSLMRMVTSPMQGQQQASLSQLEPQPQTYS